MPGLDKSFSSTVHFTLYLVDYSSSSTILPKAPRVAVSDYHLLAAVAEARTSFGVLEVVGGTAWHIPRGTYHLIVPSSVL